MDLQDFWQENKRWVLGVLAGLIVFWIASSIVNGTFDGAGAVKRVTGTANAMKRETVFGDAALKLAREENARLTAKFGAVRDHVAFVPDDAFVLTGKGDPDVYFPEMERRVRAEVFDRAQAQGVDLDERDLKWAAPVGRDEQEATLLDLCVLRHAALRLLEAGAEVLQRSPEAIGLQTIESMNIDKQRGASAASSRRGRRGADADVLDLVDEHRVRIDFRADLATLQLWLAKLRGTKPTIGLAPDLKVTPGEQIGDPIHVVVTLSGLIVKDLKQDG